MSKTQTLENRSVFREIAANVRIAFSALLKDEEAEDEKTLKEASADIKKAFEDADKNLETMEKKYGASSSKGGTTRKGLKMEHIEVEAKEQPSQKRVKSQELEIDER